MFGLQVRGEAGRSHDGGGEEGREDLDEEETERKTDEVSQRERREERTRAQTLHVSSDTREMIYEIIFNFNISISHIYVFLINKIQSE